MRNALITYEWYGKLFTSQDRLWELSQVNLIKVEIKERNQYGSDYFFTTLDGQPIACFYKDSTFGFGSQATGIHLSQAIPNIVLPPNVEWTKNNCIRFISSANLIN